MCVSVVKYQWLFFCSKQGWKRPLDTPKRMIERRERGNGDKYTKKWKRESEGKIERERERKVERGRVLERKREREKEREMERELEKEEREREV